VFPAHGFEILNEGFLIRPARANGVTFNMPAFYSQFSKRSGHIRPFFRYQYVNTNKESAFEMLACATAHLSARVLTSTKVSLSRPSWVIPCARISRT